MILKRFKQINEELDTTEDDKVGGISYQEYSDIRSFISSLIEKSIDHTLTDEEKILSEVLLMITSNKNRSLDYERYYKKRLDFIKTGKLNKKTDKESMDFHKIVWWLQDKYEWDYVESEGDNRVRFDFGNNSFWLNDDNTGEGELPTELRKELENKGIKISK